MPAPVYEFDPLGLNPNNIVRNEIHVLTPVPSGDFQVIIPKCAPFHFAGVTIHGPNGLPMNIGQDYTFGGQFYLATKNIGTSVYGCINIFNKTLSGPIEIKEYKTIGGDWTIDDVAIVEALAKINQDPRNITWEQLVNVPYQFPPINHNHIVDDGTRVSQITTALERIRLLLEEINGTSLIQHMATINAHHVTAELLNLGNVANYKPATDEEALEGTANDLYTTIHTAAIVARKLAAEGQIESMQIYTSALQEESERILQLITGGN